MKDARQDRLWRQQRDFHRHHPWRLQAGGLYLPHSFEGKHPGQLTWWSDVGFILNRRRVLVRWIHPRTAYADAIECQAWAQISAQFEQDDEADDMQASRSKVVRQRQRLRAHRQRLAPATAKTPAHRLALAALEHALRQQGVAHEVRPSWRRWRLAFATALDVVAPLEVRCDADAAVVADLAKRLLLGQTTMAEAFPNCVYGQSDWLAEAALRES